MTESRPSRLQSRPLSPHLSVYRFTWTMAMSVVHRATGMAAYFAVPLLAAYLWAISDGTWTYQWFVAKAMSWYGLPVLIGLSWAVIHHGIGGVRHIVWDTGMGLGREARFLWAQMTLLGSVILTVLLWLVIFLG